MPRTRLEEKRRPYPASPSGMPAVENSLALMLNEVHRGRCTLQQVVHWMCDAPARVWDIVGKGRIAVGYDADLVLVDLERAAEVRNEEQVTKCGWSPWHGERAHRLAGAHVGDGPRSVPRRRVSSPTAWASEAQFDHARGGYWATA